MSECELPNKLANISQPSELKVARRSLSLKLRPPERMGKKEVGHARANHQYPRVVRDGGGFEYNLSGCRFGHLEIIERCPGKYLGAGTKWVCRCDCGNVTRKWSSALRNGLSQSCGLKGCRFCGRIKNMLGRRFGKLLVVEFDGIKNHSAYWKCKCDCGKATSKTGQTLRRRTARSCGCLQKGPLHKNWHGGRKGKAGGYVGILNPSHPNASSTGYVPEHVMVMAMHMGRPLTKRETVHHKNGIRDDNRIENLELWSSDHAAGQRVSDMVSFCREYLAKYAPQYLSEST